MAGRCCHWWSGREGRRRRGRRHNCDFSHTRRRSSLDGTLTEPRSVCLHPNRSRRKPSSALSQPHLPTLPTRRHFACDHAHLSAPPWLLSPCPCRPCWRQVSRAEQSRAAERRRPQRLQGDRSAHHPRQAKFVLSFALCSRISAIPALAFRPSCSPRQQPQGPRQGQGPFVVVTGDQDQETVREGKGEIGRTCTEKK